MPIGINADHLGMTKFATQEDQGYKLICYQLKRCAEAMTPAGL
jgi:hypothetical protein